MTSLVFKLYRMSKGKWGKEKRETIFLPAHSHWSINISPLRGSEGINTGVLMQFERGAGVRS